jgi:hypothetical protein
MSGMKIYPVKGFDGFYSRFWGGDKTPSLQNKDS